MTSLKLWTGLTAIALAALVSAGSAIADGLPSELRFDHSTVRLLAGDTEPDGAVNAGLEITLMPGWKTYWRVPGDAGIPPQFDWKGSVNLSRVIIDWPAPKRYNDEAGESIGYKQHVVFPLRVVPQQAGQPVNLSLDLFYAVCKDICIPGSAKLAIGLPAQAQSTADNELIAEFRRNVPQAQRPSSVRVKSASVRAKDGHVVLSVMVARPDAGDPADIFVEGLDLAYFRKPERVAADGQTETYELIVDGTNSPDEIAGQKLTLTITTGKSAVAELVTVQ